VSYTFIGVAVSFYHCDKIHGKKLVKKRKDLFWLMFLEASDHGQIAPLLLGCGEAEDHGGEGGIVERDCSRPGSQETKKHEGAEDKDIF
jgi:hypothetical protein